MERAAAHKGFSFVEIYTNCLIFNNKAFDEFSGKETRKEKIVNLEHGKPLIFGNDDEKGIRLDGLQPKVVELKDGYSASDLIVHNEKDHNLAFILARMSDDPQMPRPMGVYLDIEQTSYDRKSEEQIRKAVETSGEGDVDELLKGNDFWAITS
jgi:2-oxoglutarate ferredoxin oxidoreductase subunit beta